MIRVECGYPAHVEAVYEHHLRRAAVFFAITVAVPAFVGWIGWLGSSRNGADPYDGGPYWLGTALTAFVCGLLARSLWSGALVPFALIAYPFWNTPQLAEESHSPFGPLGVVFLILYLPVLAGLAMLGAYLRRRPDHQAEWFRKERTFSR